MSPLTEPTKLVLAKGQPVPVDLLGIGSVSLLLHGNGANGSTTITDSSPSPKTVTAVGNAQISTAQGKFGGSSIAFDGNGDWVAIPNTIFLSAYTIEAFIYMTQFPTIANGFVNNTAGIYGGRNTLNGPSFRVRSDGSLNYLTLGATDQSIDTTATIALNQWVHVAASRDASNIVRLFINGVLSGSGTQAGRHGFTRIADTDYFGEERFVSGFMDEARMSSVCRYTSNFTPPTAPFPDI